MRISLHWYTVRCTVSTKDGLHICLPPEVFLEEAVDMLDLEDWKLFNLLKMDSINNTEISQLRAILGSKLVKLDERYWAGTGGKTRQSCRREQTAGPKARSEDCERDVSS